MPDVDGDTRITIGCIQNEGIGEYLVFDGQLQTTSRVVSVEIVPGKMILKQNVPNGSTRIRIWVNHPVTPNDVVIGLG